MFFKIMKKNYLNFFVLYKNGKKNSKYERRKPNSALSEIFMRTRKI